MKLNKKELLNEISLDDYYEIAYPVIFYICGLLAGALLFRALKLSSHTALFRILLTKSDSTLASIFIESLALYIIVFSLTIISGLCVIGFPVINFIPLACGIELAIKLSYYYNVYNIKGVGYSLLLIIPQAVMFMTIIIITIEKARRLSRELFSLATSKQLSSELMLTDYLKSFALYAVIIVAATATGSLLTYLLNSIVSI